MGGGHGTHKSSRTTKGGGVTGDFFRNASLEMHKFISSTHLLQHYNKASSTQKPSGPNGQGGPDLLIGEGGCGDLEKEEIKTDESLKELEFEQVVEFYRINEIYEKRAKAQGGPDHQNKKESEDSDDDVHLKEMPSAFVKLLKSFADENDAIHYEMNCILFEQGEENEHGGTDSDKNITDELIVQAEIMDNYN